MARESLGDRIRQARFQLAARRGRAVTQTALAASIGVSPGAVSQWENGTTEPTLSIIPKLAQALGVTPGWLAFGESSEAAPLLNPATDRKLTSEELDAARAEVAALRASQATSAKKRRGNGH
jgi:transcriptional regulator with XRE-family HTH domain